MKTIYINLFIFVIECQLIMRFVIYVTLLPASFSSIQIKPKLRAQQPKFM